MDKQQFEELIKLLKKANEHLEHISSHLDKIGDSLEKVKNETRKKRRSMFDL